MKVLLKKDLRSLLNLRRLLKEQSRFKMTFILLFAGSLLAGLWVVFLEGFRFLDSLGGIGLMLINRLSSLFFFGMGAMLFVSSMITSYTTFFRDAEVDFLLLKPIPLGQTVLYRYLVSAGLSSWAFFFIIIPYVGAYAWYEKLPLLFTAWTFFFSVPFVLLCCGIGTVVCLLIVRWLPRGRYLFALILIVLAGLLSWGVKSVLDAKTSFDDSMVILNQLIPGMRLASHPLWPSWWMSEGIMALTRGQWARGMMLWSVMLSNLLLIGLVVESSGKKLFWEAWQRLRTGARRSKKHAVMFKPVEALLGFVASDIRAIILKDMRVFFRDPAQWSQFFVFFGLLGLYFLNLRSFRYHALPIEWRNLIAFLNIFSVCAVMCSLASRFVYPQLSLEGHGFWILGLAPTTMRRVLLAKFTVSFVGMLLVSEGLMFISTKMLELPPLARGVALAIAAAMSFAVSGLSTGLGAVFLALRQRNTSAIVSGFGGTLNLVLSLLFMFSVIIPFGVLFHLSYLGHLLKTEFIAGLFFAFIWIFLLTIASVWLPLWIGDRNLRNREY